MRLSSVEIRHDPPVPDRRNQIVLADDAIPVFDKVDQNIEDLGLDRDHGVTRAQFTALAVERKILEQKQHVVAPATNRATISQVPLDRNQSRLKANR